jgi:hypothetical protein
LIAQWKTAFERIELAEVVTPGVTAGLGLKGFTTGNTVNTSALRGTLLKYGASEAWALRNSGWITDFLKSPAVRYVSLAVMVVPAGWWGYEFLYEPITPKNDKLSPRHSGLR